MNTARFSSLNPGHLLPARENAGDHESDIDLLKMLRTLWRGKWMILLVTLCLTALAFAYIFFVAVPLYTATSAVSLQNREQKVIDVESVMTGIGSDQASVNTEVEVLRSRGLLEKLIDQLDLETDPEFNPFLRPGSPWSVRTLLAFVLGPAEPEPTPRPRVIRDKVVEQVLDAITVSNIRQSFVFQITARTQDPEKSALIADTIADLYIRDQIDVQFSATEHATDWLTERLAQLKSELEQAEIAVQKFNSQINLVSPERLQVINYQLKDFRDRYAGLTAQQALLDERVEAMEAARESGDLTRMEQVANTPALTELWQAIASGNAADEKLFEQRFDELLERARFEARRNSEQLDTMATSIVTLQEQVAAQSAEALHLEQLQREAEASRMIYEHFLGRLKETSVQQGIHRPEARILSYATLPLVPSSPRPLLLLPLSFLVGLVAGSALVVLREMGSQTYRTPEEVESHIGTTVIGQIPRGPSRDAKRILDHIASKSNSAMSEAVRNLRTSILLSSVDRAPKIIMMTSSVPAEGKTTLSLALAQNLAGMGKKVLVIEGDIRRRTFSEIFQVKNARGLLTAVLENAPIEEVVHHEERLGIDILFGERAKLNAADFFSSDRFRAFLDQVRSAYDFVVIDTPPVLMVPDARVIAQHSDVVIYVVRWDSTPRRQVAQGVHAFSSVNAPVSGMVLSQIDPRGMKSYGYSGTYGQGYATHSKSYYDG